MVGFMGIAWLVFIDFGRHAARSEASLPRNATHSIGLPLR
jgi:hypothetical protein